MIKQQNFAQIKWNFKKNYNKLDLHITFYLQVLFNS